MYFNMESHKKKSHNVLSEFTTLCWAAFRGIPSHVWPAGRRSDTPDLEAPVPVRPESIPWPQTPWFQGLHKAAAFHSASAGRLRSPDCSSGEAGYHRGVQKRSEPPSLSPKNF